MEKIMEKIKTTIITEVTTEDGTKKHTEFFEVSFRSKQINKNRCIPKNVIIQVARMGYDIVKQMLRGR